MFSHKNLTRITRKSTQVKLPVGHEFIRSANHPVKFYRTVLVNALRKTITLRKSFDRKAHWNWLRMQSKSMDCITQERTIKLVLRISETTYFALIFPYR